MQQMNVKFSGGSDIDARKRNNILESSDGIFEKDEAPDSTLSYRDNKSTLLGNFYTQLEHDSEIVKKKSGQVLEMLSRDGLTQEWSSDDRESFTKYFAVTTTTAENFSGLDSKELLEDEHEQNPDIRKQIPEIAKYVSELVDQIHHPSIQKAEAENTPDSETVGDPLSRYITKKTKGRDQQQLPRYNEAESSKFWGMGGQKMSNQRYASLKTVIEAATEQALADDEICSVYTDERHLYEEAIAVMDHYRAMGSEDYKQLSTAIKLVLYKLEQLVCDYERTISAEQLAALRVGLGNGSDNRHQL